MNKREYLLTSRGAYSRYLNRFTSDYATYCFYVSPKSKRTMKKDDKITFQLELLKQMKQKRKRSYRENTRICIEMRIYINSDDPPHIHKIPKNYLDLLSIPVNGIKTKRKSLLFKDDMQVAYLNVFYKVDKSEKARIEISVYKFNSFIEDLRLAHTILNRGLNDFDRVNSDCFDYKDEFADYCNSLDSLEEYRIEEVGMYVQPDSDMAKWNKIHEYFLIQRVQENFCRANEFRLDEMYELLCKSISYEQKVKQEKLIDSSIAQWIESFIGLLNLDEVKVLMREKFNKKFKLCLKQIPTNEGEKSLFKESVRNEMIDFKKKNEFLQTLFIPVSLKVQYKSPVTSNNFHKDLDNIMRIIVPIFHEQFNPPISVYQKELYTSDIFGDEDGYYREFINKLPKGITHQILGYEIIEIPREKNDNEEGYLIISMGYPYSQGLANNVWEVIHQLHEG